MTSILQSLFSILLGLALLIYGLVHSITRYPGGEVFSRLAEDLPTLGSVLLFILGLLAVLAGLVLVVHSLRQFQQRWRMVRALTDRSRGYVDDGDGREYAGGYR